MKNSMISKGGVISFLTLLLLSCENTFEEDQGTVFNDRTLTVLVASDNNLDNGAKTLLSDIMEKTEMIPINVVVLWISRAGTSLYYKGRYGTFIRDKLSESLSLRGKGLSSILKSTKKMFPSDETGLILWSHGTGWLPSGRKTRSFGDVKGESVDIDELACNLEDLKYDYIVFDACFMGCIEVLWDMRKCSDYFVSSPTEVPTIGILNNTTLEILAKDCDLETRLSLLCDSYINSCPPEIYGRSISVMRSKDLTELAEELRNIGDPKRFDTSGIPCYPFRLQKIFFDFRAFLKCIGCESLYSKHVMYYGNDNNTEFASSGLSIFVPSNDNKNYIPSYETLSWNQYVNWLKKFE